MAAALLSVTMLYIREIMGPPQGRGGSVWGQGLGPRRLLYPALWLRGILRLPLVLGRPRDGLVLYGGKGCWFGMWARVEASTPSLIRALNARPRDALVLFREEGLPLQRLL